MQICLRLLLVAGLFLPGSVLGQDRAVWGTSPEQVMVAVFAQFDEESDELLWHEPLESADVHSTSAIRIQLAGGGPRLYLPISPGEDAASRLEAIRGALGQLVRLEFHPTVDTSRGAIHASWTWSVSRGVVGEGHVPITNPLYSAMLRRLGDEVPNTGVFAPLASTQRRLDVMVRNVTDGNGREVDELAEDFLAAAKDAGLPLEFYRLPGGERASEEAIQRIKNRGYTLSAVDYWNEALGKFRGNRIVSPTLQEFETAWSLVPKDERVMVELPGRGQRVLSSDLLHQFRVAAGQKFLDAALSAARAGESQWTGEMLRRFEQEIAASGLSMSDFQLESRPARQEDLVYLVKLARGETGFIGFFRAIWHRILAEAIPSAPPT